MSAGRSINLALAERGIHALKLAGVFEEIQPELVPMRGRMLHALDGSLELQPYGSRENEVIYSVSRAGLNQCLITAAETHQPVNFTFDAPCESIDLSSGQLTLHTPGGGETVPFEVLIGTDGAGSVVRSAVMAATDGNCSSDFLDHGYKELCIPAGPDGSWQIDGRALHIWPRGGYMLIALPNTDGSFTLTLFLANEGDPSFHALQDPQAARAFFAAQFPDALALIPDLEADFRDNPTGLLGTVRCWPWHIHGDAHAALLVGDAAHAIVPFHGQGMNAGFEDCVVLCECLDHCGDNTLSGWKDAMLEFAQRRKPDADAIAEMALDNYIVMRDSVRDPKFHLRKQLEFELERRFPERFIPRYSMVMFHRMPYSAALQRGRVQADLLDELLQDVDVIDAVDFEHAALLIKRQPAIH
jgi:kynurenine 3-monooxygenase